MGSRGSRSSVDHLRKSSAEGGKILTRLSSRKWRTVEACSIEGLVGSEHAVDGVQELTHDGHACLELLLPTVVDQVRNDNCFFPSRCRSVSATGSRPLPRRSATRA